MRRGVNHSILISIALPRTETSGRFNTESYVVFLKQLLPFYKGKIIFIEDGALIMLTKSSMSSVSECWLLDN